MPANNLSPAVGLGRIKPWVGRLLLEICEEFPTAKPLLRKSGLRTCPEWFPGRIVRVQLPEGKGFNLASFSENYLSFELFWRGAGYYEPITTLLLQTMATRADTFMDVG